MGYNSISRTYEARIHGIGGRIRIPGVSDTDTPGYALDTIRIRILRIRFKKKKKIQTRAGHTRDPRGIRPGHVPDTF